MKRYTLFAVLMVLVSGGIAITSFSDDSVTKVVYKTPNTYMYKYEHNRPVRSARFSKDGEKIVTTSDTLAYRWTLGKQHRDKILVLDHGEEEPVDAWFNGDGTRVLTRVKNKNDFLRWDNWDGKRREKALSRSGKERYLGSSDKTPGYKLRINGKLVFVVNTATGKKVSEIRHRKPVKFAAFNHDGTKVVTASGNNAYVWRVGKTRQEIKNEKDNRRVFNEMRGERAVEALDAFYGS